MDPHEEHPGEHVLVPFRGVHLTAEALAEYDRSEYRRVPWGDVPLITPAEVRQEIAHNRTLPPVDVIDYPDRPFFAHMPKDERMSAQELVDRIGAASRAQGAHTTRLWVKDSDLDIPARFMWLWTAILVLGIALAFSACAPRQHHFKRPDFPAPQPKFDPSK